MASRSKRLETNAAGDFYVDSTCIDCGTCRWVAPASFNRAGNASRVYRQPADAREIRRAQMALLACPTGSIGTGSRHDLATLRNAFPDPIADEVHHCGYHAESSFGAASYLIVRSEGNVMIDSPRFTRRLADRIEAMGGIRTLFLTHRDDIADQAKFRAQFGCDRVIHARDVEAETRDAEVRIEGDDHVSIAADLVAIPVPGHTEGSMCLLYRDTFLFSGDHVAFSPRLGHVYAFRDACWYDWREQRRSVQKLLDFPFEWVLPGHSHPCRFAPDEMRRQLERCVRWMSPE